MEAKIIRCKAMGLPITALKTPGYLAFQRLVGFNWRLPYNQNFGRIGRLDNAGRGYWFSVDTHGNVRTHHYSSSGFGRS